MTLWARKPAWALFSYLIINIESNANFACLALYVLFFESKPRFIKHLKNTLCNHNSFHSKLLHSSIKVFEKSEILYWIKKMKYFCCSKNLCEFLFAFKRCWFKCVVCWRLKLKFKIAALTHLQAHKNLLFSHVSFRFNIFLTNISERSLRYVAKLCSQIRKRNIF